MILQVGVKILIRNDKNEFLFLRRSKIQSNDTVRAWDIPGGRIEPGESLDAALSREVYEETGLTLSPGYRLVAAQDIFVIAKDMHVVRLTYVGEAIGTIVVSNEHDEFRWATVDAARQLPLDKYVAQLNIRDL